MARLIAVEVHPIEKPHMEKKDHEVNSSGVYNVGYSKSVTISQLDPTAATTQSSKKPESNSSRPVREKLSITPIPVTYGELFPQLLKEGLVAVNYVSPLQPPYPHWYKTDAHCDFHGGIPGHNIETCITFKKVVQNLINAGIKWLTLNNGENRARNKKEGDEDVLIQEKRIVDTTPLQERRNDVPFSKNSLQERMVVDISSFQERRNDAFKK
ncbi:hypothetical protein GQ457_01G021880 [Hibiscus cannabinus]